MNLCIPDLFVKGFSQSGTALDPWVIQDAPLLKARQLAASLGCNQKLTKELVDCMRERPAKQIMENIYQFYGFQLLPFSPFAPAIEPKLDGAFLTEHPYELLRKGNVKDAPWLVSTTTDEGIFPAICEYEYNTSNYTN